MNSPLGSGMAAAGHRPRVQVPQSGGKFELAGNNTYNSGALETLTLAAPIPGEWPEDLDLSILLPCLNEEETVGGCVRQGLRWLAESGLRGEVIVVDNGSEDRSAEIAAAEGARVINEPERGKGRAFRRGVLEARGRVILLADSDGTYDLSHLEAFLSHLQDGSDMVIGNRLRGKIEPGAMPWLHRYVGNPLFSLLISLITRQHFGDVLSGIRSAPRDVWRDLWPESDGFEL